MSTDPTKINNNADRFLAGGNAPVVKLHKHDFDELGAVATATEINALATINAVNATSEVSSVSTFYKSFFKRGLTTNMAVDGTIPLEYTLEKPIPTANRLVAWELSLYMQAGGNLEPLGFGSDSNPLVNGVELKHDNFVIENWKTVYHLAMDFNREEADFLVNNKRNLNGVFSFQNAGNIKGYSIAYDANFRIIIQDDMTTVAKNLDTLYIQLKGNLEPL